MYRQAALFQRSLFFRLAFVLAFLLIPVVLIGMTFFYGGEQSLRKEILGSMEARVEAQLHAMEREVERIQVLQYEFMNNGFLNTVAVAPDYLDLYARSDAILQVQNALFALKNSSGLIKDTYAHIPAIGKTVSAMNGVDELDREQFLATQAEVKARPGSPIQYWQQRPVIVLVHDVPGLYEGEHALFSIVVELSVTEMIKSLSALDVNDYSGTVLMNPTGELTARSNETPNTALEHFMTGYRGTVAEAKAEAAVNRVDSIGEGKERSMLVARFSKALQLSMIHYVPEHQVLNQLYQYRNLFWIFAAVFLVFIAILSLLLFKMIHRPLLRLLRAFRKMEKGELEVQITSNSPNEFGYLFQGFNKMSRHMRELIEQVYTQKILVQRAELKQLQSQINPHFLYNSYFTLYNMIAVEDHDSAKQFAAQMGSYLRYITRNSSDEVPLQEEARHAKIYTDIQERRFRLRMKAEFGEVPEAYRACMVPRLILQPLIENAFEHVFDHMEEGGRLRITFEEEEEDRLLIRVADNGALLEADKLERLQISLRSDDAAAEMTGLLNINRRLRIKYGGARDGVWVDRSELGGMEVTLSIWREEHGHAARDDRG
ncbi:histidine kinase [Paenibacillus sp. GCM10027626]|uniref:sensor histidine kinase n=1 Tax=Paenibacillus sp. GCM10027626 TaxID=3273411 RepID=UPI0036285C2A